ncbi:MAG: S1 family peptidase [Bdellovibrionia bacterium]
MKLNIMLFLPVVSFLTLACQPVQTTETIYNGSNQEGVIGGVEVTSIDAVSRSTVGIYSKRMQSICTGTLIAENMVLTAAHCIDVLQPETMLVYFGSDMRTATPLMQRDVAKVLVHPLYDGTKAEDMYDVAVLKFYDNLPQGYAPAKLLNDGSKLTGARFTVAGYGLNWAWGIKKGSGVLRKANLKLKRVQYGATEMILDQSLRKGICSGDSGGPAYLEIDGELHVAGVASRGDSIPLPLMPDCFILSVYGRVDKHLQWIEEAMRDLQF